MDGLDKLQEILRDEPKYRLAQAQQAVFVDLIENWSQATALPADLRVILQDDFSLQINAQDFFGGDKNVIKALITLSDGQKVESVLMRHQDGRNTVCVSSQVGCPLGCLFCATGQLGLTRSLETHEIIAQVLHFQRLLKKSGGRVSNVVFMGMGEPFLNYDNVMGAIHLLNDKDIFNIGARKISVSTAGIIPGIEKFIGEPEQVNLAISLHAPFQELRAQLMPISQKYPLPDLLAVIDKYIKIKDREVMFEYLLIDGVNDTPECAVELAKLMSKKLHVVNLILYNDTGKFKASPRESVEKFKEILEKKKVKFTQRYRFGDDIGGACGQLVAKN